MALRDMCCRDRGCQRKSEAYQRFFISASLIVSYMFGVIRISFDYRLLSFGSFCDRKGMAGYQRIYFAAMLQPVEKLSDDDAAAVEKAEPMKKPASSKPKPKPKAEPKSSSKRTPMKRPAAASSTENPASPTPRKRPATRDTTPKKGPKIGHYLYKTGVWGYKIDGKQRFRVTQPQPGCTTFVSKPCFQAIFQTFANLTIF